MAQFTVLNPATEQPVTTVTQVSAEETDAAIERAAAAQVSLARHRARRAGRLLRAFAAEVDAHVDELASLEVAGSGHPIGQARWEAGQVRDVLLVLLRDARAPPAGRSRWQAGSTSRSPSRSGWSA